MTFECVLNLVYTDGLPEQMVLRYLIAFPGSIGGPVCALGLALVSMFFGSAVWLAMTYSVASGVGFATLCFYIMCFLAILIWKKSEFSSERGTTGALGWEWIEQEHILESEHRHPVTKSMLSERTMLILRKRGQQALELERKLDGSGLVAPEAWATKGED